MPARLSALEPLAGPLASLPPARLPVHPPVCPSARLLSRPHARPPACCKRQLARMVAGESHSKESPSMIFMMTMALKTMVLFIVRVFAGSPGWRSVQSEHDWYSGEEKNDTTTFFCEKHLEVRCRTNTNTGRVTQRKSEELVLRFGVGHIWLLHSVFFLSSAILKKTLGLPFLSGVPNTSPKAFSWQPCWATPERAALIPLPCAH